MFIKSPNVQIKDVISQTGTTPAATNSALLTSRRGNLNAPGGTIGQLNPITFDLYKPFLVPSEFTANGSTALAWAKSIGGTVVTGTSGTVSLADPDTVTINVSTSTTVLSWNSEPVGFSNLLGGGISGTVTQIQAGPITVTGTLVTVSVANNVFSLLLSNVAGGTFLTTDIVTVDFNNSGVGTPNGQLTEQWILDLYYFCNATVLNNTLNLTFVKPQVSLSIVSDLDDNFNANPTPIDIGNYSTYPTVVSVPPSTVTVNPDGTVLLAWNAVPDTWIYVPMTAFGTTVMAQGVGNSGTIVQQMGPQFTVSGTGVSVLLDNVVGTFNTVGTVVMTLDSTVTTFSLLYNNYYKVVNCGYQITTQTDFNVANLDFQNYINSVNTPEATTVRQFGTVGVFGQTNTLTNSFLGNIQPNSNNFYCASYYYPNRIQDVYIQAPQASASHAGVMASNSLPYPNYFGTPLNGLPVSSDPSTYITVGITSTAEAQLQYGYSPTAVNQNTGQAYIYMPVTTEITIPNSNVPDQEFYDIRTKQVVVEINARAYAVTQQPQFLNTEITPTLTEEVKQAIFTMTKTAESDNLIFNASAWFNSITVVKSNINPHMLNVSFVIQISPALTGFFITVNLVSSLISPPTTQA